MPPPRRSRRWSTAAEDAPRTRRSGRLSVKHRAEPFKREGRRGSGVAADDDDGLPLSDEALLLVFSSLSGATADLVRCAATCRRWRRLVSADASFICRGGAPPRSDPIIRNLALGFFHFRNGDSTAGVEPRPPRFVPLSHAAKRRQHSFAAVAGAASRVVAARNGYVVVDLLRGAKARSTHAVRLGVCNPVVTGGVDVLPPLRGKDSPTGPYACTVITAADELHRHHHGNGDNRLAASPHSSYLVILLYNRRSYTSEAGMWGPETEVTGARIGRTLLAGGDLHAAVVVHGGSVFWPPLAVGLPLASLRHPAPAVSTQNGGNNNKQLRHTVAGFSSQQRHHRRSNPELLVGVTPDGRVVRVEADGETIRAYCGGGVEKDRGVDGGWCKLVGALPWKWTMKLALMGVHTVRLRWLGERSGVVVFTAGSCFGAGTHVYTLDVETKEVRMVATGGESPVGEVFGYEMDRVTLLASLGR